MKTIPMDTVRPATPFVAISLCTSGMWQNEEAENADVVFTGAALGSKTSTRKKQSRRMKRFKNAREIRKRREELNFETTLPPRNEKPIPQERFVMTQGNLGITCPCCHQSFEVVKSRIGMRKPMLQRILFRYYRCGVCDHRFREFNAEKAGGLFFGFAFFVAACGTLMVIC